MKLLINTNESSKLVWESNNDSEKDSIALLFEQKAIKVTSSVLDVEFWIPVSEIKSVYT